MVGVGDQFPEFEMNTCEVNGLLASISHGDIDSEWTVMYFYPKDFTFICPTEISAFDKLSNDVQVIGVSGDNEFCKKAWKESNELIKDIEHPLAADSGMRLGYELGIVSEDEGVHYRATYIIDPNNMQIIWRGMGTNKLPDHFNKEIADRVVKNGVSATLENFPPPQ